MSKKNWSSVLSALARTALAFAFVLGQTAWGVAQGENPTDKPSSNAPAKAMQTPPSHHTAAEAKSQSAQQETATEENSPKREESPRGGQHEGIKVHGHWTIEVRNPDGRLVTHREFENSLQSSGSFILASVLGGAAVPGFWEIRLDGPASTPSACLPAPVDTWFGLGNPTSCIIIPNVAAFVQTASVDPDLFLTLAVNSSGTGQLVLNGTATATVTGSVASVSTILNSCSASGSSPSACAQAPTNRSEFTAVTLPSAVQVSVGQTIAVTVNISFS